MDVKKEITIVFKDYLKGLITKDYKRVYASLYEDDLMYFKDKVQELVYQMDEFGESQMLNALVRISKVKQLE